MNLKREEPKEGQESVWDYPRPPRIEPTNKKIRIEYNKKTICESDRALRVLETSHPPVYYIPPEDFSSNVLQSSDANQSFCEWKGTAKYFDIVVDNKKSRHAAWSYPEPAPDMAAIKNMIAVYAHKVDACYVNDEKATPQEGGFYGGWITSDLAGPFKGGPGSMGW